WGAFGIVPKRTDGHWATDELMFRDAGRLCFDDWHDYHTRAPWRKSVHGATERPGIAGGQPDFGLVHHWWNAMTAFPDFRAARLSSQVEGWRKMCHREIDGSPFE